MSYNIDTWKTKRLKDLSIRLSALYPKGKEDWHPDSPTLDVTGSDLVIIACGCEQIIQGHLKDGILTITKFGMSGEGSGHFYHDILEPALEESTGELEAVLVWEHGDSITRLVVRDGEVSNDEVDL